MEDIGEVIEVTEGGHSAPVVVHLFHVNRRALGPTPE